MRRQPPRPNRIYPATSGLDRYEPSNNFRVDFGFWTGTQLIAIEIDGNEPEGYAP
jgi:hypothetical protein